VSRYKHIIKLLENEIEKLMPYEDITDEEDDN
jgi:hypothetical protein